MRNFFLSVSLVQKWQFHMRYRRKIETFRFYVRCHRPLFLYNPFKTDTADQGWQYRTVGPTPHFLLRSTVRWYGTLFLQWYGYGTLVRYAVVVMVRVRYVGTLFEVKTPDFLHIAPDFCIQRQKTAEADAKCVN